MQRRTGRDLRFALGVGGLLALSLLGASLVHGEAEPMARLSAPDAPRRIISTNLPADEILLGLGAAHLVALSAYADEPRVSNVVDEAKAVPHRVRGEAEAIVALRPDLVFSFPYGQAETRALLTQAGVPVVNVPAASSLDDIRGTVRTLAAAIGRAPQGEALIAKMNGLLDAVRTRVAGAKRPSVLLLHPGGVTAGAHTLFDELVQAAGGRNAASEAGVEYDVSLPIERALSLEPDVIVLLTYVGDRSARDVVPERALADDPLFRHVKAVRDGRVHVLTERHLLSTSHHAAKAALDLARILHPERMRGVGAAY